MQKGKARADDTYHVGDEADDTKASRLAGVVAIGAAWGAREIIALEASGPDYLFRSVAELHSFLLSAIPAHSQ